MKLCILLSSAMSGSKSDWPRVLVSWAQRKHGSAIDCYRNSWLSHSLLLLSALFTLKAYVEMYSGKIQKKEITYKTIPQITHAAIALLFLSGFAFHIALWPVYGGQSMFLMFLVGTFLLNFCLLFPTIIQNLVGFALLTFFIQEYQ